MRPATSNFNSNIKQYKGVLSLTAPCHCCCARACARLACTVCDDLQKAPITSLNDLMSNDDPESPPQASKTQIVNQNGVASGFCKQKKLKSPFDLSMIHFLQASRTTLERKTSNSSLYAIRKRPPPPPPCLSRTVLRDLDTGPY